MAILERVVLIDLKERHKEIIEIVKKHQPITSEAIATLLNVTRSAIRSDLNVLIMSGHLDAKPKVGYFYIEQDERTRIAEYLQTIRVQSVQSLPAIVDEKSSVYDAVVTLFLEDAGTLCVAQSGYLVGVLSRKDLLKAAIGSVDTKTLPVGMIMTRMPNVITCTPFESVYMASKKLIDHQIDSLPVVETELSDGVVKYKVVGRFSKTSVTNLFVQMGKSLSGGTTL